MTLLKIPFLLSELMMTMMMRLVKMRGRVTVTVEMCVRTLGHLTPTLLVNRQLPLMIIVSYKHNISAACLNM